MRLVGRVYTPRVDAGVETFDESLFGVEGGYGEVVCDEVRGVWGRDGDAGLGSHGCGF